MGLSREYKSDRGEVSLEFMCGVVGALAGLLAGTVISQTLNGYAEYDIEQVQAYNAELQHELSPDFNPINQMILNEDHNSFQFDTVRGGVSERCTGDYLVTNAIAQVSGRLSCAQSVQLK